MENRKPLYERLKEHSAQGRSSFHTPGHKCSSFLPPELLKLDLTELPDTDALFEANGIIRQCEKKLSQLYSTEDSFISAGGCSLAIQAMLRAALRSGGRLLCARNAHRSAVNACALLGIEPLWICPHSSSSYTGRTEPSDIEKAFEENDDITACYITSPSYYGELCDISAIADICHRNGAILLVDNAHGSHLAFMKEKLHPIALGADMSACSLHKTMPVMTGGAVLNTGNKRLAENARSDMSLFGSTSPSYVIMASIDLCVDYMLYGDGKKAYADCEKRVGEIRKAALRKGIVQPQGSCDPLRLTFNTALCGIRGEKAQLEYFEAHGIDCEFCDGENAVLLCTPFNSERDFQRVESAIEDMPESSVSNEQPYSFSMPEKVISLRKAMLCSHVRVKTINAQGRIAADTACPCPPGVPVIMPGERIDQEAVELLLRYGIDEICVADGI